MDDFDRTYIIKSYWNPEMGHVYQSKRQNDAWSLVADVLLDTIYLSFGQNNYFKYEVSHLNIEKLIFHASITSVWFSWESDNKKSLS